MTYHSNQSLKRLCTVIAFSSPSPAKYMFRLKPNSAARAIACALEQVDKLHNWDTGEGVKLQLHLGLGTGPVRGVDLGNHMRREYVVAGEFVEVTPDAIRMGQHPKKSRFETKK